MLLRTGLSMLLAALLASPVCAHGGQYRGPWNAPPAVPGGPTTGGPGPGLPGGPTTGGRPAISDGTSWQVWWEFSKDPLVEAPPEPLPVLTGSDDYFLGRKAAAPAAAPADAVSDADRKDRIAAALAAALRSTGNRDVVTACMIGLGKLGVDPPGAVARDLFVERLADGDQEVRESAALALGIGGQPAAMATLVDLLQANAAGRKLAGGDVSERSRTFAAWGIGLLARRGDAGLKQRAHDVLLQQLHDRDLKSRDLRVGLIEALGLLDGEAQPLGKRLAWQTVAELWQYYEQDLGKGDQLIQAHVPIAVARLLGRGDSSEHQAAKRRLLQELTGKERRHNAILQSAAMALGSLAVPEARCAEDAACRQQLLRYYQNGSDQLTRFFSVLALGRIGGDANRQALLQVYGDSNRSVERPWLALALGLIARQRLQAAGGAVDQEIGRLLARDFDEIDNFDTRSAVALALGLCGYEPAAPAMLPKLDDGIRNDMQVGYVALGLGLLGYQPAADKLVAVMQGAARRPFVLQQCALALVRLRDPRAVPLLQKMLADSDSAAVLSVVATALGYVGDRRSIDPLIATLADADRPRLAQAFAAAALGSIGDKDPLPWNTPIAIGMNYMATVDTLTNGSTGVLDIL